MAVSDSLIALLQEQLQPLGQIAFRRMFSGAGVYCDGVIFALILRDALHFKVDDANRAAYEAEGMAPFSYTAKSRTIEVGAYWRVPERLFDEPEEMIDWARAALAAGRRAAADKTGRKPKGGRRQPQKRRRSPARTA
jgi:DNA transformation protein